MTNSRFSRRDWLKTAALATTPVLLGALPAGAGTTAPAAGKTPALTAAEIAAVEAAIGKKGTYVEAQATHSTPLPRNDLKVTIKGESVPIPFGFGGWVAIKHTLDGKSAMLMSDTVLLQEEVIPLCRPRWPRGSKLGRCTTTSSTRSRVSSTCTSTAWAARLNWPGSLPLR